MKMNVELATYQYTKVHWTLGEIARYHGVTKQAVWKALRKAGIGREEGTFVDVLCSDCGKSMKRRRCNVRKVGTMGHFCGSRCYHRHIGSADYSACGQHQKIAKAVVGRYFPLDREYEVHHIDGDSSNNSIGNLWVFRNHAEHMGYHRTRRGRPIFKGENVNITNI